MPQIMQRIGSLGLFCIFLRRKIQFDIANISYDANLNLNEIRLTIFENG
jgi:hypothetical protein